MHVPHEVPLGPRIFVNRRSEFVRLAEVLPARSQGRVAVGLCTGLPGVGKTALVRRYVEQVRSDGRFPDGDLHVDFGAAGDGPPVSVSDALASCLTAMGVGRDVLPGSVSERANLLRSVTAERSLLIVLDDVTEAAQVLPFLPRTPANAVLVTSSGLLNELVLDGAERIDVLPLAESDAAELAAQLCGERAAAEPEAFAALVASCAGLPVALRVAAGFLLARPGLRVAELVARIGDENTDFLAFAARGKERIMAVFGVTYNALPRSAAHLYRALGVFPSATTGADVAALLAGTTAAATADDIDALLESGLVVEDARQRLTLHPLVRQHARHVALEIDPIEERRAALRRAVGHLLVRAAFADRAVLGSGRYRVAVHDEIIGGYLDPFATAEPRKDALQWLCDERATFLPVLRAAFADGMYEQVWVLAEAVTALYVERRYLVDWTESSRIGAEAAHLLGNHRAEARLRSFSSRAWTDLNDRPRAADELDRALPMAEATGDVRLIASVWELIGRLRDETDPHAAPAAFERAIELFRREKDIRGAAFVQHFLGRSLLRIGRTADAVATLEKALAGIRAVGDPRMEGRALTALGEALGSVPDVRGAERALDSAIEVLMRSGSMIDEAVAQERRADLAVREGDMARGRRALGRALDIYVSAGSPRIDSLRSRLREVSGS